MSAVDFWNLELTVKKEISPSWGRTIVFGEDEEPRRFKQPMHWKTDMLPALRICMEFVLLQRTDDVRESRKWLMIEFSAIGFTGEVLVFDWFRKSGAHHTRADERVQRSRLA